MNLKRHIRIRIYKNTLVVERGDILKQLTIIGKPNVGKTLFLINFAEFLGIKELEFEVSSLDGLKMIKRYSIKKALEELVDNNIHKTRQIYSIIINVPLNKGKKTVKFIDTVGFIDNIHPEKDIRKGIAYTLQLIQQTDIILHIIDSSAIDKNLPNSLSDIDFTIAKFAEIKKGYCILANKIDLPEGKENFEKIRILFRGNLVIPISAKYKKGFKEVKSFVISSI
ncbi:GTPase [Thermovenabulum sp.]|uniref:GTPase n=1 Tax=Thermovenabulum sp. TaxID=3100335 RepID=UPI003C7B1E21